MTGLLDDQNKISPFSGGSEDRKDGTRVGKSLKEDALTSKLLSQSQCRPKMKNRKASFIGRIQFGGHIKRRIVLDIQMLMDDWLLYVTCLVLVSHRPITCSEPNANLSGIYISKIQVLLLDDGRFLIHSV
ncbi:hypothetical protein HELRODRAFT_162306 [Helobdella robusta]|uniref:Uncharacterized protein n=1 Tax=Helobdella robusta TaxID=6412 RepID=T1ESH5_HELRO|nr:hypothetical protein HELRODRAFT_162306 [Helobdella robusta]ESN98846.1 hypothetical protein HELRODRAFT_162306 [Helobdella robusta]